MLESAVRAEARALYVYDLGRAQLALGRAADAVASLRRALQLAGEQGGGEAELEKIHYQLGIALHRQGAAQEAKQHLAEARRLAARWTDSSRRVTTVGPAGAAGSRPGAASTAVAESSPLAQLPRSPAARARGPGPLVAGPGVSESGRDAGAAGAARAGRPSCSARRASSIPTSRACSTRWASRASTRASSTRRRGRCHARSRPTPATPCCGGCWRWPGSTPAPTPRRAELLETDPELATDPQLRLALGMAYKGLGQSAKANEQFRAYEASCTRPY